MIFPQFMALHSFLKLQGSTDIVQYPILLRNPLRCPTPAGIYWFLGIRRNLPEFVRIRPIARSLKEWRVPAPCGGPFILPTSRYHWGYMLSVGWPPGVISGRIHLCSIHRICNFWPRWALWGGQKWGLRDHLVKMYALLVLVMTCCCVKRIYI